MSIKTFTPLTLFAIGIFLLIVGGILGYVAGYDHRAEQVSRYPPSTSSRPIPSKGACAPAGCSGQLCVDANKAAGTVSTCEFRAEYACYRTARCERQSNGECGWTQTAELRTCLQTPPPLQ